MDPIGSYPGFGGQLDFFTVRNVKFMKIVLNRIIYKAA